eukprot:UN04242
MRPFLKKGRKAIVLDGGMGTTLAEQGADVASVFWSASMFFDPQNSPVKPQLIYDIHKSFLDSGAEVIIANTYKISKELLDRVPKNRITWTKKTTSFC